MAPDLLVVADEDPDHPLIASTPATEEAPLRMTRCEVFILVDDADYKTWL